MLIACPATILFKKINKLIIEEVYTLSTRTAEAPSRIGIKDNRNNRKVRVKIEQKGETSNVNPP